MEHLRSEYHESNGREFDSLTSGSHYKALWVCGNCHHEWKAEVCNRVRRGSGCPVCARSTVAGKKKDTHAAKNPMSDELYLQMVTKEPLSAHSHKSVEWRCAEGHVWRATVSNRTKGKGCPFCSGRRPSINNNSAKNNPELIEGYSAKNGVPLAEITPMNGRKFLWECPSGHEWQARLSDRARKDRPTGCPRCANHVSKAETEIADYLSRFAELKRSDRTLISPKELDIYIPSKNVAVEFNGLYWHTESKIGKTYHQEKYLAAKEAGIQLITVWEDDWNNDSELVKRMLKEKIFGRQSLGARKTNVVELTAAQARKFLGENHIQGFTPGTHYTGLMHNEELVSVMVTKVYGGTARLERFASTVSVSGGMDKMMKHLRYQNWETFADHCVSDGGLYEKTGWSKDKEIAPDYRYVYRGQRVHKFNFRLKRFRDDSSLIWEDGLTESQLARLNGIDRIYDAGKTKYVKTAF